METIIYKGHEIKIEQDMHPSNPIKDWDGNCLYALSHNNYSLQNDTDLSTSDYNSWDEFEQAVIKKYRALAILPVYMYDHSGQTINTTGYSCRWDSGQIGFVFVNKKCLNEWGYRSVRGYEKGSGQTIQQAMIDNVKLYDNYITGEVYGFYVTKDGEDVDSCWGYYGAEGHEDMIAEVKSVIDHE